MSKKYLILGAGIAGFTAADRIRQLDPNASVTMVTMEKELPYLRPLLSKTWFRSFRITTALLASEEWYQEKKITLLTGCEIDRMLPSEKKVLLKSGQSLDYDRCIYALGARSFLPELPGIHFQGVYCLRTVSDFRKIRLALATARKAIVVGAGMVGLEIAWQLKEMDMQVSLVEAALWPMSRILDEESAGHLIRLAEEAGLSCYMNSQVQEILSCAASRVSCLRLSNGFVIDADLIIFACGNQPVIHPAKSSDIACGRGILVNSCLQTSSSHIFAAGDCVEGDQPNPGLWNYARQSALIAAENAVCDSPSEMQPFLPAPEPAHLHAMGISLFAMGETGESDSRNTISDGITSEPDSTQICSDKADCIGSDAFPSASPSSLHQVNPHEENGFRYAKYFYKDHKLCGAILMGDLSQAMAIRKELERNHQKGGTKK